MVSLSSTALSGMNAAQARLQTAAHNLANLGTEGFTRQEISLQTQTGGGVQTQTRAAAAPGSDPVSDVVSQLQAKNAFLANLSVFKTQDKLAGALLDLDA